MLDALECGLSVLLVDADVVFKRDPSEYLFDKLRAEKETKMIFQSEYGTPNYLAHANSGFMLIENSLDTRYAIVTRDAKNEKFLLLNLLNVRLLWRNVILAGKWWWIDQAKLNHCLVDSSCNPQGKKIYNLTQPKLFLTGASVSRANPKLPQISESTLIVHANWTPNLGRKLKVLSEYKLFFLDLNSRICLTEETPPPLNISLLWPECGETSPARWDCDISERRLM